MNTRKRRELKLQYRASARPAGVFLIRNITGDRVFVAAGQDLNGTINRHRFQLEQGIHSNQQLQEDWRRLGSKCFTFEVLDQLDPSTSIDLRAEVEFLEREYLNRLRPFAGRGYNEPAARRMQS